jgi:hypothetical protein
VQLQQPEFKEMNTQVIAIGVGATVVMDLWAVLLSRVFGIAPANYAMVGRWIGTMRTGRFVHASIAAAPRVQGEKVIGWAAHYAIGIAFAVLLVAVAGYGWVADPSIGPAIALGIVTVVAPFFLMQPGMGLGVAAAKTPEPNVARVRSLMTHIVFGFGLYVSAWVLAAVAA